MTNQLTPYIELFAYHFADEYRYAREFIVLMAPYTPLRTCVADTHYRPHIWRLPSVIIATCSVYAKI